MSQLEADCLRLARAVIEDQKCWTQDAFARDADGADALLGSHEACAWCSLGAVGLIDYPSIHYAPEQWLHDAANLMQGTGVVAFNDANKHSEVLAMFDLAIELAEASQ